MKPLEGNPVRFFGLLVSAMLIAACGTAAAPSSTAGQASAATTQDLASAVPTVAATATVAPTPTTAPSSTVSCENPGVYVHQAPELEALLPARVDGRDLTRWSVVGRCWMEMLFGSEVAAEVIAEAGDIDLQHLRYAIAGRTDTRKDPPYFVFGADRPIGDDEADLAALLMFVGAKFDDPLGAASLERYDEQTIAGKAVYVGTTAMLEQDEHQRGRPYLYQSDEYLFLLVTDDVAWATEALATLP
jgi:hypothetical protein